ncbi:malic enzyme [Gilbertella persicaria]|uniref:Malic enzyme n=1 Tax=Rhizopus stolonifer TaxID=4846 RepID=A0A367JUF2_RHIST|nr:malic enzyme [Gilbertella persicaria]KAI8091417.1 malic enzyme [Gilbertella persicaria]RCH93546.1 hypothetical protein CU098_009279 [Rhizopus stolonifer]
MNMHRRIIQPLKQPFLARFHTNAISRNKPLYSSFDNTGTSLPTQLREKWHMTGHLPATVESMEKQADRALKLVRSKSTPLEKYMTMAQLRSTHTRLFYKLIHDHIEEFAPIIYTPTVGEACQKYSDIYPFLNPPGAPDGLYITLNDLPHLKGILECYKQRSEGVPDIAVLTDGSRILGLGDLGINGMPISMGKLQLYVAGAGMDPRKTLPIVLDFGTNNEMNMMDEFYLGVRDKRPDDPGFYDAMDRVLQALHDVFPDMLIQFEDFSSAHAFGLLKQYRHKLLCFNDDIQGTGAVVLAGLINAFRKVQKESKVHIRDHRILFYGAGSAAIGVAKQIQRYLETEHGLTEQEAKDVFYVCDSKGLITLDRGDTLAEHKVYYARQDNQGHQYATLDAIVDVVKPTTLIGLSSTPNAFNPHILSMMCQWNNQPIVFPLSNPATKAECTFEDAMKATDNKVIFASGTAFPAYVVPETKQVKMPGQGNNMYIFPGLGLGAVLAKSRSVSDDMLSAASMALADSLSKEERQQGWLYPSLVRIRQVSASVATAVMKQAIQEGLAKQKVPQTKAFVTSQMWSPEK